LRQKQYEYYRDLLLSFPKPDVEVAAWYEQGIKGHSPGSKGCQ
jgi:hypothetical protein